jgi:hypothetical protein
MISCKLQGGLGNYLFQIAAMHSLTSDAGFDVDNAVQVHGDIKTYLSNILRKIKTNVDELSYQYNEPEFTYQPLPYHDETLYIGYFQSEKYLQRDTVLDLFAIDDETLKYLKEKYADVLYNSVSLHVRRGDYLHKQNRHPAQKMSYYTTALEHFEEADNILIFSDDIDWCKENFIGDQFKFITDEKDYMDLWLMSLCDHNIIANSSFSWWGAWLNQNIDKKVIAPSNWFGPAKKINAKDIYCENWIVI